MQVLKYVPYNNIKLPVHIIADICSPKGAYDFVSETWQCTPREILI